MSNDQLEVLTEQIAGLQHELVALRGDVARLRKSPLSGIGWRAWPAGLLLCVLPLVISHSLMGMFGRHSFVRAVHLEGSTLGVRDINLEDSDGQRFGSVKADSATLNLRHHDGNSEVYLNPDGLRLESADADTVLKLAPYATADGTKGVRIQGYLSSDSKTGGSLFLALPDGKEHTKPRLVLLDAYGRPVE